MEGGLMSKASDPRLNLNLEQQRKRAKELRRGHGDGSLEAAERIVRHLPRTRGQTVAEVLASPFTLSEAQLVVAREAGFPSWPRLKQHIELSRLGIEGGLEALLAAAVVGDSAAVQSALAASPELPRRSIHVAAALGDVQAALRLLEDESHRATERGGLRQWTPLHYGCSSRHGRGDAAIASARVRIAERLLALGADPNDEIATYDAPGGFRSVLQGAVREVASAELVGVLL